MAPLREQLLFPQRLAMRLTEDSQRVADAAVPVGVEPLQAATERVGRVAERLPGPGRKG